MQQGTILDTIKKLQKQREELTEAINNSTQIALVAEMGGLYKILANDQEIDISDQLKNKIIKCFQTNNRECFTNFKISGPRPRFICGGNPRNEPKYNDINDEDFKQKINTAIKETPMSVQHFSNITVNNNRIHVKQEINNNYQLMCCADITADMNGNIEAIELHYTGNVEIQNEKQLDELNQLLKQNLQNITGLGVNISNIMLFLSYLTNNQMRINPYITYKVYFIYGPLLQLNQEYEGIKTDVANLPRAIEVKTDKNELINDGYLSLKAIKDEFPKYKKTIDTAINSISSKIDTFKTKLRSVNGNDNEQIENNLNEMKQNLHNTEFGIGSHGINYKPNENKIIQSSPYTNYDDKNECWVEDMVEIKLDSQYNIKYLLFIDKTKNKTIKILPNIPFYLNGKKFTLEDCILHHNAGLGTKWIDGGMAENSTKKIEQFEQIEKQQKKALAKKLKIEPEDLWHNQKHKKFNDLMKKIIINNTLGISVKEFNEILKEKFNAKNNEEKIKILSEKSKEIKKAIKEFKDFKYDPYGHVQKLEREYGQHRIQEFKDRKINDIYKNKTDFLKNIKNIKSKIDTKAPKRLKNTKTTIKANNKNISPNI